MPGTSLAARSTVRVHVPAQPLAASIASMADWSTQERWYPATGRAGLSYFPGVTPLGTVDCLLWRGEAGELIGLLNHYPFRTPEGQQPGSINLWVKPTWRRRGIGTRLLEEADRRWQLDLNHQTLTPEGVSVVKHALRRNGVDLP